LRIELVNADWGFFIEDCGLGRVGPPVINQAMQSTVPNAINNPQYNQQSCNTHYNSQSAIRNPQ
jgi:hypothetical protein